MRAPCVAPRQQARHPLLPTLHVPLDRAPQRLIKARRIPQRTPALTLAHHSLAHFAQVVDGHAAHNEHNALISQAAERFPERKVLRGRVRVEDGDLHDGDGGREGVGGLVERDVEDGEDAVVEAAGGGAAFDARGCEE